MNKKITAITTLALVGIFALGGTVAAYASSNNSGQTGTANKATTAVVAQQKETADQELTSANTKTAITEGQAKQIALNSIQGGTFKAIELEDENGVIVYGVKIQAGTNVYDVKVDANKGTIIKSEQDNDQNEQNGVEEKADTPESSGDAETAD
ncbi:PepSY domain-containing protein [Dehalobacter sp. TeCB1]|uniref:PepSY domain-containing protein n=1 Tax=Dehalobacter sp. TeCB1 TaxID=1843715 RepID=UPI00083BA004|nr:PepSY domain-containing protein [Dehalobacter sp. TeCB1]OCZ49846.1 hypothetical protein A7D23_00410 [Dehalobacter sp. TeCB1]